MREYDSAFCANTGCVLHVRPGDMNVKGCGNWAELADGIIVGRQQVEGVMLSDRCAARILITLYQSAALLQKEEALAGASPNH